MKKVYKLIIMTVAVAAMFFTLCACGGGEEKPKKLPTPSGLTVSGSMLTWDEVWNADKFLVSINGAEYEVDEASCNLIPFTQDLKNEYNIKVKAIGDGKRYTDSDYSEELSINSPKILLQQIDGSSAYRIVSCDPASAKGHIRLPDNVNDHIVTEIADYAFRDCTEITGIEIPDSIGDIGVGAFFGCTKLKSVALPAFLREIKSSTFQYCRSLEEITVTDNVTEIGNNAFWECSEIKAINIPAKVTKIGSNAFADCSNISNVSVDENNQVYKSDGNCIIRRSDNMLVFGFKGCVIPVYVGKMDKDAFAYSGITDIVIPERFKEIPSRAFRGCGNLKSVTIEEGIEKIGSRAFSSCTNLTEVYVPSTVTDIGIQAFSSCSSLIDLSVSKDNQSFSSENNCILNKAGDVLMFGCKSSVIPNDVRVIDAYAFYMCMGLEYLELPRTLTEIRTYAFYNCYNWKNKYIPESVVKVEDMAFASEPTIMDVKDVRVAMPENAQVGNNNCYTSKNAKIAYDDGYAYVTLVYVSYNNVIQSITNAEINGIKPIRKGYVFGGFAMIEGGDRALTVKDIEDLKAAAGGNYLWVYPIWIPEE